LHDEKDYRFKPNVAENCGNAQMEGEKERNFKPTPTDVGI